MKVPHCVHHPVFFYAAVFSAAAALLLLTVGSSCDSDIDYQQVQAHAQIKFDNWKSKVEANSIIIPVPYGIHWLGNVLYKPTKTQSSADGGPPGTEARQASFSTLVAFITIDNDFDNKIDVLRTVNLLNGTELFVDKDGDGLWDEASEPHIEYFEADRSILISNPEGGEVLERGSYQVTVIRKIFEYAGPQPYLLLSFPITLYFDDAPPGVPAEVTYHKAILRAAQVIPQIAVGRGGTLAITTQIALNNPNHTDSDVALRFYEAATGKPLTVTIDGVSSNLHQLKLPAMRSRTLEPEIPETGLAIGWALVQGNPAVEAAADYVTFSEAAGAADTPLQETRPIEAEAGIAATGAQLNHVVGLSKGRNGSNTALAIVNPTDFTARIKLTLIRDGATESAANPSLDFRATSQEEIVAEIPLEIPARNQRAQFFDELFGIDVEEFTGTALLESDTDISVMLLKTVDGKQSASLPSGFFTIGRGR